MEKFHEWDLCKSGDPYVRKFNISGDRSSALYGYSAEEKEPATFDIFKGILKAAASSESGIEIVTDWTFGDINNQKLLGGIYDFGGKHFIRKSDGKVVRDQALVDATVRDDLDIVGPDYLRLMVKSKEKAHGTVYIVDYSWPAPYFFDAGPNGVSGRRYRDGGVKISPSEYHTELLGGRYREEFAYTEMKRMIKDYAGRTCGNECESCETYNAEKNAQENPVADIGKGENSGVNFRPARRRRN